MIYATILILFILLQVLMSVALVRNFRRTPRLDPNLPADPGPGAPLSVIIPARNEEKRLPRLIESLRNQDYANCEFLVVDDESTDRTAGIVREAAAIDPRLRLITGGERPAGWLGKNWAVHQGTEAAGGEWLLFLDADTTLHPRALTVALHRALHDRADLLTLVPRVCFGNFAEQLVQPVILQLVLARFSAGKINDPNLPDASANGPFLLFRRSAYLAVGGHQAIRSDIVEDLTLARRIKENGFRLLYLNGQELQQIRMYDSFAALWRGWSKNFFEGFNRSLTLVVLGTVFLIAFYVLPWLPPLAAAATLAAGTPPPPAGLLIPSASLCALQMLHRLLANRSYRITLRWAWLQPVAALVVAAIAWNSARLWLGGHPIPWKGK